MIDILKSEFDENKTYIILESVIIIATTVFMRYLSSYNDFLLNKYGEYDGSILQSFEFLSAPNYWWYLLGGFAFLALLVLSVWLCKGKCRGISFLAMFIINLILLIILWNLFWNPIMQAFIMGGIIGTVVKAVFS